MSHLYATIARTAARQHGRVSTGDLRAAEVDPHRTKRWVADGRLIRVHRDVYAVGHRAPSALAEDMAAVLACGTGAALSHRSAAYHMRLLPARPRMPEVTVPTTGGRRRPGIVIHRVHRLPQQDTDTFNRIAITTVPRVLLDLAPRLDSITLGRACHEAWVRHRVRPALVEACIARNPTKKGAAKLRLALGSDVTLSMLEDGFLALLRANAIAKPRTNIDRFGDKVDCHWPELGLTVELHSYRFHASRAAFEKDLARRRRSEHVAFSYGDVFERGPQTIGELRQRMAKSSNPSGSVVVTSRSRTDA